MCIFSTKNSFKFSSSDTLINDPWNHAEIKNSEQTSVFCNSECIGFIRFSPVRFWRSISEKLSPRRRTIKALFKELSKFSRIFWINKDDMHNWRGTLRRNSSLSPRTFLCLSSVNLRIFVIRILKRGPKQLAILRESCLHKQIGIF